MPDRVRALSARSRSNDLSTFANDERQIVREQSDQLLPTRRSRVAARERSLSEKILVLRYERVHAEIERRDGAIRVLADDDVALFGAQEMHCFRAVGCDV